MSKVWVLLVALALAACGQVDPGERAVFTRWGVMDQKCYGEGFYWYNPISTNMDEISIKQQKYELKKLSSSTSDIQEIHADIVVNYRVDGQQCHELLQKIGHQFEDKVIQPAVIDSLKEATAHHPINMIIRERKKLREDIIAALKGRLQSQGLIVMDVALTDFGVSPTFAQAVEQKQIAEQRVQQAEYQRQQAVKDAEAAVARADGQSKSNKLLADSLRQSPETIEFRRLEVREKEIAKWNGNLPQTILGGGNTPLYVIGGK